MVCVFIANNFSLYVKTNRTTARIFPAVLDVENPEFKRKLDRMVEINEKLLAVGESNDIPLVKNLKRIPIVAALASEILAAYLMPPIESGSVDFAEFEPQLTYWFFFLYKFLLNLLRLSSQVMYFKVQRTVS